MRKAHVAGLHPARDGVQKQRDGAARGQAGEEAVTDYERVRNLKLATVWRKNVTSVAHYSISATGPHLTLTKRLDVLRRALEAAYDAGAKSERLKR